MKPAVSVIIPTFNRWDLTAQCLKALSEVKNTIPFEVVVIDNASTDETWQNLRSCPYNNYLTLRTFQREKNENFSGACNFGAYLAEGEYLCFLNNDTVPFDDWLEPLVNEFTNRDTGVVGAKLCYSNGTIQHAGVAFMRESKFPYHPYRGFSANHPAVNHRRELQVVTGACMLIPVNLFQQCGGFNIGYVNGGEDIDLCLTARSLGRKVVYQPASALIHFESQSPGRMDANSANCDLFFKRWGHALLADEDAFYFDDGFYRVGDRLNVADTPLRPFSRQPEWWCRPPDEFNWLSVAYAQRQCVNKNFEKLDNILQFTNDWPEDAAVHEWAAMLCEHRKLYRAAFEHLNKAVQLQKKEKAQKLISQVLSTAASKIRPFA